jgi:transposase-like protein
MDFPIIDLLDEMSSIEWLMKHLHAEGLKCPHCQAMPDEARLFRVNRGSGLRVYRCRACDGIYNLYSGTIFEGSQLTPPQVVLLLRGALQGQSSAQIAREIGLTEKTVLKWRHRLQANAERLQPDTPLPDQATESDEMFQNAGEKRRQAHRPGRPTPSSGEQAARARDV